MSRHAVHRCWIERSAVTLILLAAVALLPNATSHAQTTLHPGPLNVLWPSVQFRVAAECGGTPVLAEDPNLYRVIDNGEEIRNITVACTDTSTRASFSASLVFDASGSMDSARIAWATEGGHAFVDRMDGVVDEAAVLFFTEAVSVSQQMTTVKPVLHSAIDTYNAIGMTALWDGVYQGVIELINSGMNAQRAVVVLTDGEDIVSQRTMTEVVELARRHRIRIYTIGVGDQFNRQALEQLAAKTYGRAYTGVTATEVVEAYAEIASILSRMNFGECVIEYTLTDPPCAEGGAHTLDLELQGVCGDTGLVHVAYSVPLDSTTWTQMEIGFDDMVVKAGESYVLSLQLRTPMPRTVLPPLSFHLEFGAGCASGLGFPTSPDYFYAGKPLVVTPEGGGLRVSLVDTFTVEGAGPLLKFMVSAPVNAEDTVCCDVTLSEMRFGDACYIPVTDDALVCIVKALPDIDYRLESDAVVDWNPASSDYVPNPVSFKSTLTNTGDLEATNLRLLIEYDHSAFVLTSHTADSVAGSPVDLAPGTTQEVIWNLQILPRSTGDTLHVCVTAMFDNYRTLRLCKDLYVPPAGVPLLDVECPGPLTLVFDAQSDAWVPNPFSAGVRVKNTGTAPAKDVRATLTLPPGFDLMPGDSAVRYVPASPLLPWTPGDSVPLLRWTMQLLRVPPACRDTTVMVAFTASGTKEDGTPLPPVTCSMPVHIVAPIQPSHPPIRVIGSLAFCEGDSVELDAGAGFQSYLWSNGMPGRTIVVRQSGEYFCMMTGLAGCPITSDTVSVTVHPLPVTPVITRQMDMLTATDAAAWQWYRDGVEIGGATSRDLQVLETGSYRVRVENGFGCVAWSDPYDVTVLDVAEAAAAENQFELYPNPAVNVVAVRYRLAAPGAAVISVCDVLGRELLRRPAESAGRQGELRIDLAGFPAGLYHVRLQAGSTTLTRQLLLGVRN